MGKQANRRARNTSPRDERRSKKNGNVDNIYHLPIPEGAMPVANALVPKNEEQKRYINIIKNHTVTVCTGKPGTGKTFIPAVLGAQEMCTPGSKIKKFILVRPNEPLGKSLGMLPGDLNEKMAPWLEPIADGIRYAVGDQTYKGFVQREVIQPLAIEHARGRTFNNAYVVIDEAQNISKEAMICLLTRVGMDCKLIICGDIAQKDIKGDSGLGMLMELYNKYEFTPFQHIELETNVRSRESAAFYDMFKAEGLID